MALSRKGIATIGVFGLAITLTGCTLNSESAEYTSREVSDGTTDFVVVENPNGGAKLSYSADGPLELIEVEDGGSTLAFKDMNANGELDPFEDWRLDATERAADLAETLSAPQISGLMLFSSHERTPADGLTDAQKTYLKDSHLRNVLSAGNNDVSDNVTWVNAIQAYVETLGTAEIPYVPANFSSDPRNSAGAAGDGAEGGSGVSEWPSNLGMAALGDVATMEDMARIVSAEYRGLGITNALSPQIDLATEPRWLRVDGTLGEDAAVAAELAAAYVRGFQGTYDENGENVGWGLDSVPTTIKHAPGDGAGEGGRESHTYAGKYEVFPGGNLEEHASVFAAAKDSLNLMMDYSVQIDAEGNPLFGDEDLASVYNTGMMDYIHNDIGFRGAIVTDWGVMSSPTDDPPYLVNAAYGLWDVPPVERYFIALQNGVDMFGGVNDATYISQAYDLWNERFEAGEVDIDADTRWRESGARILTSYFAPGLFDSPFVDLEESEKKVGAEDNKAAGYEAQLNSVVLLKNDGVIEEGADWSDKTVYIPHTFHVGWPSAWGPGEVKDNATLNVETAEEIFGEVLTDTVEYDADGKITSITAPDLTGVDAAFVGLRSPDNGTNTSFAGLDRETGEYYPLSLQWAPYTADGDNVPKVSLGGDILPDGTKENRSYFGKTSRIANEADIQAFQRAEQAIAAAGGDIPIITVLRADNAVVPAEFESKSAAVLAGFGVSDKALFQVATGGHNPQAVLPIGFPASMDAVEKQLEDVGKDMETWVDSAGNDWTYGYGLDYSGVIAR